MNEGTLKYISAADAPEAQSEPESQGKHLKWM